MSSATRGAATGRAALVHPTSDEQLFRTPTSGLDGDDEDRLDHLVAELSDGFRALARIGRAVSVFGSARTAPDDPEYMLARRVARAIGGRGSAIITGGGPGIMEAVNRGARDAGAVSIGLTIELPVPQPVNAFLDLHLRFDHFFIRKLMFVRYASAFVVFPGGFGTLDELFEAATLLETATIKRFPVVLCGAAYWAGLVSWLRAHALRDGKIDAAGLTMLHVCDDPVEIADIVAPWTRVA